MRILLAVLLFLITTTFSFSQLRHSENIVIVTMDGLRWQEVFTGADSLLTFDSTAIYSERYVQRKFWAPTAEERRKKLMPFLWSEVAANGALLGNRHYGNFVENANPYWFSYPGYNELFTGFPDPAVNSNDKIPNKNENVLEYLHKLPEFKGKVAAIASWDVFAYILNEERSGILVNDGFRNMPGVFGEKMKWLNEWQHQLPDLFHGAERLDAATFPISFEYMKIKKPRVLFIGLGDTDEFAHMGMYDYYLDAAQKSDAYLKQLWDYIQSDPFYADKTTLLITTDHGRGLAQGGAWRHHGKQTPHSNEMWMAAIGPSVPATGESRTKTLHYQGQLAATIAAILGIDFEPSHRTLPPLSPDKL